METNAHFQKYPTHLRDHLIKIWKTSMVYDPHMCVWKSGKLLGAHHINPCHLSSCVESFNLCFKCFLWAHLNFWRGSCHVSLIRIQHSPCWHAHEECRQGLILIFPFAEKFQLLKNILTSKSWKLCRNMTKEEQLAEFFWGVCYVKKREDFYSSKEKANEKKKSVTC